MATKSSSRALGKVTGGRPINAYYYGLLQAEACLTSKSLSSFLLPAIRHLLFVTYYSPLAIRYLLLTSRHLPPLPATYKDYDFLVIGDGKWPPT